MLDPHALSGVLKISVAEANNLVPTTGLTPCIFIVHVYTCNYNGAEKKHRRPLAFPGTVNGVIVPILHPCTICRVSYRIFCWGGTSNCKGNTSMCKHGHTHVSVRAT